MSYRTQTVYIQGKTLSRLRLVKKLYPHYIKAKSATDFDPSAREASIDEIADEILNKAINDKYPDVIALEANLARVEREAMEKLKEAHQP